VLDFFLKMFGIQIGCSVIRFFYRQNFITRAQVTKTVIAYLVVQIAAWIFVRNFYLRWVFCFAPSPIMFAAFKIYLHCLETQFQSEFPDIVTSIILQMKMGHGFRKSFQDVTAHAPSKYVARLRFVYENVVFSPHKIDKKMTARASFLREIIEEFKKVDQSTHKSVEKLENFRRRLSIIAGFRRRSGRIRGQVQLQAGILLVIYALSFAFVVMSFTWQDIEGLVWLSLLLFTAGLLLVFYLGKDVKWKI